MLTNILILIVSVLAGLTVSTLMWKAADRIVAVRAHALADKLTRNEQQTVLFLVALHEAHPTRDIAHLVVEADAWRTVKLPEQRRLHLIAAGVGAQAALHPSTQSLTDEQLRVMTALRSTVAA